MDVNPTTGDLYAVDWWNQRIERFDSAGTFLQGWGQRGTKTEPGSINFAWDLAIRPTNGYIYLANRESHEIEVFDSVGNYVTRWGNRGTALSKFAFPQGVVFDPTDGSLLEVDSGNDRIQRFQILGTSKGKIVTSYGSSGTGAGQFDTPCGISVAADGTIWVADTQNNRIQKRSPSGTWTVFTAPIGGTSFKSPWGVTVGPDGNIWVADTAHDRIVEMMPDGTQIFSATGADLGVGGPIDAPYEVEFGLAGQIYVSTVWDNRIIELTP
jgi:DNA-binding beta-propeller fold protein YncE